jgi:hypothetical protein
MKTARMVAIAATDAIFPASVATSRIPPPSPDIPSEGRLKSMVTISRTVRRTETQDGAVLLDIERGQMFCLNSVGSKILELIASGCGEQEIAHRVSAEYGADIDIVRADVREFLEALTRHSILQPSQRPTSGKQAANHDGSDQI